MFERILNGTFLGFSHTEPQEVALDVWGVAVASHVVKTCKNVTFGSVGGKDHLRNSLIILDLLFRCFLRW